ncbi:MAG: radical SAM protein [Candidatus Latescibacteria bacterium]|nr:radical SAM protein [Candidatus Latescibacterota bacterium]NIM64455.1 radical SAM protein [Candidatus Latescibacterota bacterium]NIO00608.1 radical SAM protein [Candidatus Latescibacterota bacterium]NIO27009.1 radical SAM protein [Candidatus Latescibacterota bacterium]NIO56086.1 radical SAM protein [Candidatus Latescibacterota bacterium]
MHVRMVFCDKTGRMYDHPDLALAGQDGPEPVSIPLKRLIHVPRGSDFMVLPGRLPIGIDPVRHEPVVFTSWEGKTVFAAAVFMAPAHVQTHWTSYKSERVAPTLPLFAYTALGYADGKFYAAGFRVDESPRQDPWRFEMDAVRKEMDNLDADMKKNRVVQQLKKCALAYGCRAAQNFFLGRWEAPLPTSVACNATCVGCISQQKNGTFKASHDRLTSPPSPDEVADVAVFHIERVDRAVVSFGQGCEGEPLLMSDLLYESIKKIRARTDHGTINLNSNGSMPPVVEKLIDAGLDSIRISVNSLRKNLYDAYFKPNGYTFGDVNRSIDVARNREIFVSLNFLVFPGVTDTEDELEAFEKWLDDHSVDMIQMRNLNIDPELYVRSLPSGAYSRGFGMQKLMASLKELLPSLKFGYFNPAKEFFSEQKSA